MIYNSNPYKRKMESMQVNVAPSTQVKPNEPAKPVAEQPMAQQPAQETSQPVVATIPPIEVTPYVPKVEGVEVPAISLEDISNPAEETTEAAQPAEATAEEGAPIVDSSEPAIPEPEEVVEAAPVEEAEAETTIEATSEETTEEVPATHYFYCTKPDGKEVVYRRNTASASYESEITSFRKYLEKEGIIINREEIK